MATTRTRDTKFLVNNRVSVARTHFDTGGTSTSEFSQLIPDDISKLFGTIHRVYVNTQKVYVRWDCDGRFAEVFMSDITLEPDDTPTQVIDFIFQFPDNIEKTNRRKVELIQKYQN